MVDAVLGQLSPLFEAMCATTGRRPSIPPEKLLRAQFLQMLYSIRSERLLMEEIDHGDSVIRPSARGSVSVTEPRA
jgi:hypothetical protein